MVLCCWCGVTVRRRALVVRANRMALLAFWGLSVAFLSTDSYLAQGGRSNGGSKSFKAKMLRKGHDIVGRIHTSKTLKAMQ